MDLRATRSVPAFVTAALTASNVGTWQTSRDGRHLTTDATTAALFGVGADAATLGLPLSKFTRALHPADRAAFADKHARMVAHGGLFVIEYRTTPSPRSVRWVLARGRYERDPATGEMQGRGICIDITESKLDERVEDRAFFRDVSVGVDETPLDRAAALAIEARRVIDTMGAEDRPALRQAVDGLLWAMRRALARQGADTQ